MSHWIETRIPSFGSITVELNPGVEVGTRKPRIPPSVLAQMTAMSAIEASPIQRLAPSSTHSFPSREATVCILEGSLPASGSVKPKHPITSPFTMLGSHCFFCASDPNL